MAPPVKGSIGWLCDLLGLDWRSRPEPNDSVLRVTLREFEELKKAGEVTEKWVIGFGFDKEGDS